MIVCLTKDEQSTFWYHLAISINILINFDEWNTTGLPYSCRKDTGSIFVGIMKIAMTSVGVVGKE